MRKTAAAFIMAVLIIAIAGIQSINSAFANPYSHIMVSYGGEVPPRPDTQPPKISIYSPEYNSTIAANSVSIDFNVEVGESRSAESPMIWNVYYKADWLENKTYVYEFLQNPSSSPSRIANFSVVVNVTGVPEGKHSIIIYATERGTYYEPPFSEWPMWSLDFTAKQYGFEIIGASSFTFNIDLTPLAVSLLPIRTERVAESGVAEVSLNFTLSDSASKISYVLDGQDNVTIAGNTTLSKLPVGSHNVTVYAWDAAGNVGKSETVTFTVAEPLAVVPVAAVVGVFAVAGGAAGLLLNNRKRKSESARA